MYDYTARFLQQFQINLNLSHIAPNTWFHGLGALVAPWESLKVLRIEYLPHRGGNHGNLQVLNSATGMIWNDGMMSVYVCSLHFTLKNMDLYGSFGLNNPFAVSPMADFQRFSAEFQPIPCNNWQLAPIGSWKLLGTCLLACRFTAVHIQPGLIFLATKRHETTQSHCCWISSGVIDWSKRVHFVEEMQSAALSLSR